MTRKLDKEHLDEIMELRNSYNSNALELGNLAIEITITQQRLEMLQNEQARCMNAFYDLRKQESELLDKMRERYGEGEINIQSGTFTPTA
jgi:predicted transcriptional regulator